MATDIRHTLGLPYGIYNARYTVEIPYLNDSGTPTAPVTPDTEISIDGAAATDCIEEVTAVSGMDGAAFITLTGAEMKSTSVILNAKVASGPKPTLAFVRPRILPILFQGTAQAGASGSITLAANSPALDITGCVIRTTGGTGGGGTNGANNQARLVVSYDMATKVATVLPTWETNPASGTTYDVLVTELAVNALVARLPIGNAVDGMAADFAGMVETDGGVKRLTANALEQAPTGGGGGATIQDIAGVVAVAVERLEALGMKVFLQAFAQNLLQPRIDGDHFSVAASNTDNNIPAFTLRAVNFTPTYDGGPPVNYFIDEAVTVLGTATGGVFTPDEGLAAINEMFHTFSLRIANGGNGSLPFTLMVSPNNEPRNICTWLIPGVEAGVTRTFYLNAFGGVSDYDVTMEAMNTTISPLFSLAEMVSTIVADTTELKYGVTAANEHLDKLDHHPDSLGFVFIDLDQTITATWEPDDGVSELPAGFSWYFATQRDTKGPYGSTERGIGLFTSRDRGVDHTGAFGTWNQYNYTDNPEPNGHTDHKTGEFAIAYMGVWDYGGPLAIVPPGVFTLTIASSKMLQTQPPLRLKTLGIVVGPGCQTPCWNYLSTSDPAEPVMIRGGVLRHRALSTAVQLADVSADVKAHVTSAVSGITVDVDQLALELHNMMLADFSAIPAAVRNALDDDLAALPDAVIVGLATNADFLQAVKDFSAGEKQTVFTILNILDGMIENINGVDRFKVTALTEAVPHPENLDLVEAPTSGGMSFMYQITREFDAPDAGLNIQKVRVHRSAYENAAPGLWVVVEEQDYNQGDESITFMSAFAGYFRISFVNNLGEQSALSDAFSLEGTSSDLKLIFELDEDAMIFQEGDIKFLTVNAPDKDGVVAQIPAATMTIMNAEKTEYIVQDVPAIIDGMSIKYLVDTDALEMSAGVYFAQATAITNFERTKSPWFKIKVKA